MKKKLYLIDSFNAAKKIAKLEKIKNCDIISLNYSLNHYLKLRGIQSKNIYDYFKNSEIRQFSKLSHSILSKTLSSLDKKISKNFFFKKKKIIQFFYPIFISKYQKTFYSYLLIKKLLQKKIKFANYEISIFFNQDLLLDHFPIYKILSQEKQFKNMEIKVLNDNSLINFTNLKNLTLDPLHFIKQIISKFRMFFLKKFIYIQNIFLKKSSKILALNYDYELLNYLRKKKYYVILYENLKKNNEGNEIFLNNALKIFDSNNLLIKNEISHSIKEYLIKNKDSINYNLVSQISSQSFFKYIIWRYPVTFDLNKNLIVKNNLKKKKIIGFQHGAHYLTKKNDFHFDQDFNNCNYWISYNSTEKNYKRIYGRKKKICKIIKQSNFLKDKTKKKILRNEILYPIRPIHNLYASSYRDKIVIDKQIQIIKKLESRKKNYVLKTIFPINRENCALIDIFNNLNYAKIITGISLKNYLHKFEHKFIILDNYETTLYDSLEYSNKSRILLTDVDSNFGQFLKKDLKIKAPGRVLFFTKIPQFLTKILKLNKVKNKEEYFSNKSNFSISNYSIIDKIIN